jgi:hypothetical protein
MKITLRIEDKEKTFTNDFVKGRIFRNALKLNKQIREKGFDVTDAEAFDPMIEFAVTAFDNQFTIDEVWDGLRTEELQPEIVRIFNEVLSLGGLEVLTQQVETNEESDEGK